MSNENLDNNKIIEDFKSLVDLSKRTDEPPFVTYVFLQQVLDLINHLQAENERLREILNTDFIIPLESDDTSSLVIAKIDSIKAEAYKEFVENLLKDLTLLAKYEDKFRQSVILGVCDTIKFKLKDFVGESDDSATDN